VLSPLGFNDSQISDIARSIDSQPGSRFLSATHQVIKERDSFIISPIDKSCFKPITVSLEPDTTICLPNDRILTVTTAPAGTPISASPAVATFDASLLTDGRITVRRWQDGDWFIPFGMKGRKLVSDYLTDCKVSVTEREQQLVAVHGNDIIWVVGRRTDNRYRVNKSVNMQIIITESEKE
jgi:tRNA(Ile)-lysidine synthase